MKMALQDICLSCDLFHKILERPLQFIQKPQHLSILLRGQVLCMLRDKELSIESKSIQLRFSFGHQLFHILRHIEEKKRERGRNKASISVSMKKLLIEIKRG
jgi:hypothetical protein